MQILTTLLGRLPWIAVLVVAIVLAIARFQRHPKTSMLVVVGASIELLGALTGAVMSSLMRELGVEKIGLIYGALSLVTTVGSGCLVAAIFTERATRTEAPVQRW